MSIITSCFWGPAHCEFYKDHKKIQIPYQNGKILLNKTPMILPQLAYILNAEKKIRDLAHFEPKLMPLHALIAF